jgi:hypothetical protein
MLCEFAEHDFKLSITDKNGTSRRAHLEVAQASIPSPLPELQPPCELPLVAEGIWGAYNSLQCGRTSNGFGPNPLGWAEIASWAALTNTRLRPWEVRALRRLDMLYLVTYAKGKT